MEPVFSLCVTLRGRYHWVYNNEIFYLNPCCDQAHGTCVSVLHLVSLRLGTLRYRQWIVCRRIVVGTIKKWGMSIPVCR